MKSIKIIILFISFPSLFFAQKLNWESEVHFFFDNTEFAKSPFTIDQTMGGVSLGQFLSWELEKNHYVIGGFDASKYLGSHHILNDIHFLAYYQYKDENTVFNTGSFHRHDLLDDYSNFFFQDSVNYYKHNMDGLYLKKGNDERFVKLWLDWTGLQSETERESFFVGASAYQAFTKNIFAEVQSYLFHYAGTRPATAGQNVCDNLLAQASVGYKYSDKNWNKVLVSGGILAGFERNRKYMNDAYMPIGFAGKVDAEYKKWGTENLIYAGQSRMKLYSELGNEFYWGNPFLRGNFYLQNKLYWNVINSKNVTGQLSIRNHFSEGKMYFEQLFTLSASFGN